MQQSKTIQLLQVLNKEEYTPLLDFVRSPFFNKRTTLVKLLEILLKAAPGFTEGDLQAKNIYAKLYPGKAYNHRQLIKLNSELSQLILDYLTHSAVKQRPLLNTYALLEHFYDVNEPKFFKSELKKGLKNNAFVGYGYMDETALHWRLEYEKLSSNFLTKLDDRSGKSTGKEKYLQLLNHYFFKRSLQSLCFLKNHQNLTAADYRLRFEDDVLQLLVNNNFLNNEELEIWYKAYLLICEPQNEDLYQEVKTLLFEHMQHFEPAEARNLFTYLENSCIDIYLPKGTVFEQILQLYKPQIKLGIFIKSKAVVLGLYKNVVTAAVNAGETEWAKQFIEDYHEYVIPKDKRLDAYNYTSAYYHFITGDYDKTVELLHEVDYFDVYLKLSARRLFLQACYESKNWYLLDTNLNAYRVYIHRIKEVPGSTQQAEKRFINAIAALQRANFDSKAKKRLNKLQLELQENPGISERKWLLQKIESFLK